MCQPLNSTNDCLRLNGLNDARLALDDAHGKFDFWIALSKQISSEFASEEPKELVLSIGKQSPGEGLSL